MSKQGSVVGLGFADFEMDLEKYIMNAEAEDEKEKEVRNRVESN